MPSPGFGIGRRRCRNPRIDWMVGFTWQIHRDARHTAGCSSTAPGSSEQLPDAVTNFQGAGAGVAGRRYLIGRWSLVSLLSLPLGGTFTICDPSGYRLLAKLTTPRGTAPSTREPPDGLDVIVSKIGAPRGSAVVPCGRHRLTGSGPWVRRPERSGQVPGFRRR